jgi:16S rRNA (adenine1518-N6/adenine1519-N6)-dimethyltransferase
LSGRRNSEKDLSSVPSIPSLTDVIKKFALLRNSKFSKSLGQNFILNPEILHNIVASAGDLSQNVVLEIGAGPGCLTREILKQNPFHLIAIEKDRACVCALRELQVAVEEADFPAKSSEAGSAKEDGSANFLRLSVLEGDAPSFRLDCIRDEYNERKIKIVSNLPYNVGTRIFMNLLLDLRDVEVMVLMFQKEVADRIMAKPRSKQYGKLSVLAQSLVSCEKVMTLAPGAFTPAPKVHSCLLKLTPHNTFLPEGNRSDERDAVVQILLKILSAAFQNRRKIIKHSLQRFFRDNLDDILGEIGKNSSCRAEELSVQDFVFLAKELELFERTQHA